MSKIMDRFEDLLCDKGDEVDNASYYLALTIVRNKVPASGAALELLNAVAHNNTVGEDNPVVAALVEKATKILVDQKRYDGSGKVIGYEVDDEAALAWDMQFVGEINDVAEALLLEAGFETCRPYYFGDDEKPCYRDPDCPTKNCPLKKKRRA